MAILNHNKPSAYLVPAETFEAVMEKLEEYELARLVEERAEEGESRWGRVLLRNTESRWGRVLLRNTA